MRYVAEDLDSERPVKEGGSRNEGMWKSERNRAGGIWLGGRR